MIFTAAKALAVSLVMFAIEMQGAEPRSLSPSSMAGTVVSGRQAETANAVRAVFAAKCLECHGAHLPKPKGKFGYVLDLGRVAANPKYIIPGNLDESELYQMMIHNEMPGKKSGLVVSKAEMDKVAEWIKAGAPEAPAEMAPVAPIPVRPQTMQRRLIHGFGQLHPMSTHFPVALLFATLPAEFMWWRTRKQTWKAAVRFCVTLGALGAVGAATLGWCNAEFTSYNGISVSVLYWHRLAGTVTAGWAVLLAVLAELSYRRDHPPYLSLWFRGMLAAGAILVGSAGYLGASLVYGLDHFKF